MAHMDSGTDLNWKRLASWISSSSLHLRTEDMSWRDCLCFLEGVLCGSLKNQGLHERAAPFSPKPT